MVTLTSLLGLLALSATQPATAPMASAQSGKIPVGNLLNTDGSINTKGGFNGALDLRGWDVRLDAKRGPIFKPIDSSAANEMALPPQDTSGWSALTNNGLDSSVRALAVIGTDLYVGGSFRRTQDAPVTELNRIARYDTISGAWSALPNNGLNERVFALAVVGGDLYVGGSFTETFDKVVTDLNNIAKFSGGQWSALPNKGLDGNVTAFAVSGTDLYVGGGFTYPKNCFEVYGSNCNQHILSNIAKLSGNTWSGLTPHTRPNGTVYAGLAGAVSAMAFMGDDLYVGGGFTQTLDYFGVEGDFRVKDLNGIAKFSGGTWSALPNQGLLCNLCGPGFVSALTVVGTDLYVGGTFDRTFDGRVVDLNGIAKFSGVAWSALANRGLRQKQGAFGNVFSLIAVGKELFVGGLFDNTYDLAVPNLSGIARYNTEARSWSALPNGGLSNQDIFAFAVVGSDLFLGGGFLQSADGARSLRNVAKLGLATKLELVGIEVTQGIQNWKNEVPLIANRKAFVRVHLRHVDAFSEITGVQGRLIVRRDGVSIGEILPEAPTTHTIKGDSAKPLSRVDLKQSFLFRLRTDHLTSGRIELTFKSPTHEVSCKDASNAPNDCKAQVTFTPAINPDVRFVDFAWRGPDGLHQPDVFSHHETVRQFLSTLPVSGVKWKALSPALIHPIGDGAYTTRFDFGRINTVLSRLAILDGCISSYGCTTYWVGLAVDAPDSAKTLGGTPGFPSSYSDVFAGYVDNQRTLSHEFGHALGRQHTKCTGDEARADPAYPYPSGIISPLSASQDPDAAFYGFDLVKLRVLNFSTGDLMGYCQPKWPSDWTFNHLRDALRTRYGPSASHDTLNVPAVDQQNLLISGTVSASQPIGSLDSVYQMLGPVPPALSGNYTIRLENSVGQTLASFQFDPLDLEESNHPSAGVATADDDLPFLVLVPADASASRLVIAKGSQTLATRTASINPPTISINHPNGGENLTGSQATFRWTANDADGDALSYTVQYSIDGGGSWQTMALDIKSQSIDIDLTRLAGTTRGLLRVFASDGFRTTQAQSAGLFTVAKHAPEILLEGPGNNSYYVGGQTVFLEANAYDLEDGLLGDSALSWSSNLNGPLGSGRLLEVNSANLATGSHIITVTGKDSDGQTSSSKFLIYVYPSLAVNAIDDVQFFVSQHYLDFLDRTFDLAGFDFWIGQLTSCGSDPQCVGVRRINVSASYFLSIEFQETGYLVERTYKASYGDATATSTIPSPHQIPVPALRFDEFIADTQRIRKGVVVLQPGWEQLLESNKQAFFLSFVQGARFTSALPASMTPAQFVDQLNLNAGNVLSSTERATAIALFGSASGTSNVTARAAALRQVAEDQDLYNNEFSRAFVLMQYFGYLRRNPNDLPDIDYTGYDFWLTKLNQFSGNYITAEMVKAFLSSIEYRQRFSP